MTELHAAKSPHDLGAPATARRPANRVASTVLGLLGAAICAWAGFRMLVAGVALLFLDALSAPAGGVSFDFLASPRFLLHFASPAVIGALLVFLSRRIAGRSAARALAAGVVAAFVPVVLAIVIVVVFERI
ncbi:MAG TPA: hypothetical protein PKC43_07465 [Phycisphaerales bacterium]|nr:hypothetical protein [Phycisphaerales bacterium]HMP37273.1 hypothetical protein [Phycisphaerales bacterium]